MIISNYVDTRENIKTGDVLVWKKDRLSPLSNLFLKVIRLFTLSQFAHTAVAYRMGNRLFAIEATQPYVRIFPISLYDEFYHIPLNIENVKPESIDFLLAQVGKPYGLLDAVRAYFDLPLKKDDHWQCAELTGTFLNIEGIKVIGSTPSDLVEDLLIAGYEVRLVRNEK